MRNAFERASQVVNELGSSFYSQLLALSFSEKGKICSQIALVDTLLSLIMSHFARSLHRCALGLLEGRPPNWSGSRKIMSADLSTKLLALLVGFTMDNVIPDTFGRA